MDALKITQNNLNNHYRRKEMLFHTEEWTINLDYVASIEWEDEYKDAEVYMNDGRSYTVGEGDDFDRLAAAVGRGNPQFAPKPVNNNEKETGRIFVSNPNSDFSSDLSPKISRAVRILEGLGDK